MTRFQWDPSLATGIPSIDAQHIALFESARHLHRAFHDRKASEGIAHTLHHLIVYCSTHFEDEEAHMERLAFPGLPAHRKEHRKLVTRVAHLKDRWARGETEVAMELSVLVADWLREHIQEYDQRFAEFVRKG